MDALSSRFALAGHDKLFPVTALRPSSHARSTRALELLAAHLEFKPALFRRRKFRLARFSLDDSFTKPSGSRA